MTSILSEVLGRRVVATDTVADLGEVKTLVPNQSGRTIDGIHVSGGKRHPELVNWSDVDAVGPDAVMVSSADALAEWTDDRTDEAVRGHVDFLGSTILSTDGAILGTVSDVHFDEDDGVIVGLLHEGGRIDGERIRSIGTFAVVVAAD